MRIGPVLATAPAHEFRGNFQSGLRKRRPYTAAAFLFNRRYPIESRSMPGDFGSEFSSEFPQVALRPQIANLHLVTESEIFQLNGERQLRAGFLVRRCLQDD